MTAHSLRGRSRSSTRAPLMAMMIMVGLSLFVSGCCGSCCRVCLGSPSGSSSSSGNSDGLSSAPNSGSVASLVQQQVGQFSLIGTAPVTRLGYGLSPGVVDSIGAVYVDPGGLKINEIILAYASADTANERMDMVFGTIARECPGKRLMRSDVKNRDGVMIGKQVVCDRDPQHVYWSNGRVLTFVTASHPTALQFYNASNY